MLRLWLRHAVVVLLFLLIASCSGGGCSSGCAGCGVTPLPHGFPKAQTVPNAAAARVTRPGLDFLQSNLGTIAGKLMGGSGGALHFNVPTSHTTITFINITVCPNGPNPNANPPECVADINLPGAKLAINALTPHSLQVKGTVPVQLKKLPVDTSLGSLEVEIGNGSCGNVTYADVPVDIQLPLIAETIAPRDGYTKIDAQNAVVNATIDPNIVQICNGGFIGAIIDLFKSYVVGQFTKPLTDQIKKALIDQTCTKPDNTQNPPCPDGSQPNDPDPAKATQCVFTSKTDTCVPMLLGTQGHMDLGHLLASISPGTSGALDFQLASAGDMDPAPGHADNTNGITLGFIGGALPQPQSTCVPVANNPVPTGIPIPDEMMKDAISPWPAGDKGPHFGLAIAGRFLGYGMTSAYNSGLLCLGVSTENIQQINTGLLSLLMPSLNKLTFEMKPASAALTTRPQSPPKVKIGTGKDIKSDPLLAIQLDKFAIDFYVWSDDRYVRAFTYTADVTVPVNISTAKNASNPNGGIAPTIGELTLKNGVVSNNDLLTDDPAQIANALSGLLGGLVGQFVGNGIKPIDLSSALKSTGLALTIPDGGIRKISKGSDDFLAIFGDLALASGMAMPEIDTGARILDKTVHPEAMSLETAERSKFPTLRAAFSSPMDDGAHEVEYAWWIDESTRSAWTRERDVTIDTAYLILQGKHVLNVVARLAGRPETEDSTPAQVPFVIDTLAPYVAVKVDHGAARLVAWDLVSDDAALRARWRTTSADGRVSAWTPWQELPKDGVLPVGDARAVDVQVQDESENVGSTSQALIRGHGDGSLAAAGGCNCSTPGAKANPETPIPWIAGGAALLGLALLATRRRSSARPSRSAAVLGLGAIASLAAINEGCACGSTDSGSQGTGCGPDCNTACAPPNSVGLIGSYTSVATAKDGTIWVAGYNEGDVSDPHGATLWGDLVVGKYDTGKQLVMWTTVDGLPPKRTDGSCAPAAANTWRGGETDLGDDVGLWTSMQLDANDRPMVSYYDASHHALKFASFDGSNWNVHTVRQADRSDIGRYGKMLLVGGKPAIAYLVMSKGDAGGVRSLVEIATASTATPASPGDWTFDTAAADESAPCRARFCDPGQLCIKETGQCMTTATGCTPADCGSSGGSGGGLGAAAKACVTISGKATCGTVIDDKYVEAYPDAYADYVSMAATAQGDLGLVVYDRVHGNLLQVKQVSGKWTAAILDGETGSRQPGSGPDGGISAKDTGDVGVAASLFIAPNGDWHVSYVNGFSEALQYLVVPGGNAPDPTKGKLLVPEIVDNGQTDGSNKFPDGQHIIGDDSVINVDANGAVTVYYQDSTAGTLHIATGSPAQNNTHKWTVRVVAQPKKFAGFFPRPVPGTPMVSNFWRMNDMTDPNGPSTTGDVSLLTP